MVWEFDMKEGTIDIDCSIDHDPSADLVAQLAQEVYRTDLLQSLVVNIQKFEFEV